MSESSWWVNLPRERFYERVREEYERIQGLTHDTKLRPRGQTERPALGKGRTPEGEN